MKPSVYLAGPITGLQYNDTVDWRERVKLLLAPEISAFSPMRSKQYLLEQTNIKDTYDEYTLSTQRGIYTRDMFDCQTRDLIFVNFLGANRVSIGSVMEIAWGVAFRKPIVLVMEKSRNLHDHAMIREACPLRVETIDEGIFVTRALLLP